MIPLSAPAPQLTRYLSPTSQSSNWSFFSSPPNEYHDPPDDEPPSADCVRSSRARFEADGDGDASFGLRECLDIAVSDKHSRAKDLARLKERGEEDDGAKKYAEL